MCYCIPHILFKLHSDLIHSTFVVDFVSNVKPVTYIIINILRGIIIVKATEDKVVLA